MSWMDSGVSLAAAMVMTAALGAQGMGGMNHGDMVKPASTSETITGCVARGEKAGTYTLTNTTRSGDPAGKKRETLLLSTTDIDLSKHVGHKVSLTGSTKAPGNAGHSMDHSAGAMSHDGQGTTATFTVKSMKMIGSCS